MKKFFVFILLSVFISGSNYCSSVGTLHKNNEKAIIDCNYTLSEALAGIRIPAWIRKNLRLVNVYYYSFDGKLHEGQLVINKFLVKDIKAIFREIKNRKFPIQRVIPIVRYGWSDDSSMKDDNTSAFNYRVVKGTHILSEHAYGRAIDINPWLNPQIKRGKIISDGAHYNPNKPGTITKNSFIVKAFLRRGWIWGGNWRSTKDYQHFEKRRK